MSTPTTAVVPAADDCPFRNLSQLIEDLRTTPRKGQLADPFRAAICLAYALCSLLKLELDEFDQPAANRRASARWHVEDAAHDESHKLGTEMHALAASKGFSAPADRAMITRVTSLIDEAAIWDWPAEKTEAIRSWVNYTNNLDEARRDLDDLAIHVRGVLNIESVSKPPKTALSKKKPGNPNNRLTASKKRERRKLLTAWLKAKANQRSLSDFLNEYPKEERKQVRASIKTALKWASEARRKATNSDR